MKNLMKYALFGGVFALANVAQAEKTDCYTVFATVKKAVAADPDKVLELVSTYVAQNESCSCEVVKAAIMASGADKKLVAGIVEAAVASSPSNIRIIGQCAVAVAPDALSEVQVIVTEYGAAGGDSGHSAKGEKSVASSKSGKIVVTPPKPPTPWNPLDFPGRGPVGPTAGGPGGFPLFPPGLQPPSEPGLPVRDSVPHRHPATTPDCGWPG